MPVYLPFNEPAIDSTPPPLVVGGRIQGTAQTLFANRLHSVEAFSLPESQLHTADSVGQALRECRNTPIRLLILYIPHSSQLIYMVNDLQNSRANVHLYTRKLGWVVGWLVGWGDRID